MAMVQEPTGELPALADADVVADADLVIRAAAGGTDAFGELYRRHVDAAWRVAHAVTGNAEDAADAVSEAFTRVFRALPEGRLVDGNRFRPYLLAATRNAAIDVLRPTGKTRPTGAEEHLEEESGRSGPSEAMVDAVDRSLVAAAFRSLPERWRSVLWLTEVEGLAPSEAAPLLGVSANGAAQLAVRARAGLRQRFLQAHLRDEVAPACRFTTEHLGAYVSGGLSPRDIAKVDQHLAGCLTCQRRQVELDDLSSSLRRAAIPLPLALAGVVKAKWRHALAAGHRPAHLRTTDPRDMLARLHRPLATASAGLLGVGIVGAIVIAPHDGPHRAANLPTALGNLSPDATMSTVPVTSTTMVPAVNSSPLPDLGSTHHAGAATPSGSVRVPNINLTPPTLPSSSVTTPTLPNLHQDSPPPTVPSTSPSAEQPVVQVVVNVGGPGTPADVDVAVGVGANSCTGGAAGGVKAGDCTPPPKTASGPAQVTINGTASGSHQIGVPPTP